MGAVAAIEHAARRLMRVLSHATMIASKADPMRHRHDRITMDRSVMLGKPVIAGTRIPVELLLRKLSEGATEEELLDAYPRLAREDIAAALAYAADVVAAEDVVELLPATTS